MDSRGGRRSTCARRCSAVQAPIRRTVHTEPVAYLTRGGPGKRTSRNVDTAPRLYSTTVFTGFETCTFGEDLPQVRTGTLHRILATLRNLAIGIIRHTTYC